MRSAAKGAAMGTLLGIAVILFLVANDAAAAGDARNGEIVYAACAGCHGGRGEGSVAVNAPRLAGLDAAYVARQTGYFKAGIRGAEPGPPIGAAMAAIARALDTQAIADVAAFITKLDAAPAKPTLQGDATRGATLYATCAACHGADGSGNVALNAPGLAGASDWYLVRQLQLYKSGARGTHEDDATGRQMAPMMATLPDEQAIKDVVIYINSLSN